MTLWKRLAYLLPWRRHAAMSDMREELRTLAAMAEPGELGNLTLAAEDARAEWGWTWLEQAGQDVRYALRTLRRSPAFTATIVASLALGIGANAAIFNLVNAWLLRSLPVPNPQALVLLRATEGAHGPLFRGGENTGRGTTTAFSLAIFDRLRTQPSALSDVFAFAPFSQVNVMLDGQPAVDASAAFVSGDYYIALGVPALLGRTLMPDDDQLSAAPVAVLSFRCWQRRFGAAPDVIGTRIHINRIPTTIVGVTPRGFDGTMQAGESPDVFVPLGRHLLFQPDRAARDAPSYWWVRIMGRLRPGATAAQARASLEPMFQEAARDGWLTTQPAGGREGGAMPGLPTLSIDPGVQGESDVRQQFAQPLAMLMGLVGLVLAAACANVANLLLARHVVRRREIGLRLALGASRRRIVRQLLTESLLLALGGAAGGLLLAWWSRGLLLALRPFGNAAAALELPIDVRVLAFTTAAAVFTALAFGLVPALRATRVDLASEVQSGTRTLGYQWRSRPNQALMVVQIALSLVLLVSTGLFVRTLGKLQDVDAGFDRRDLLLFGIDATSAAYTRQEDAALQARLQERIARVPGVQAVTFSSVALLSAVRQNKQIAIPGRTPPPGASMVVSTNGLAPNFFDTMALPLISGRGFTTADIDHAPRVAVVNRAFVGIYFDGASPLGHRIRVGPDQTDEVEIVGVAGDAKYTELRGASPPTIYFPALQRVDGTANFAVRLAPEDETATASVESGIRAAVRDVDPALPVLNLRTQREQIDRLNALPLLFARLSGLFGLLALALTMVGLYGLLSHVVAKRTGEIAIRVALGAPRIGVVSMILGDSLRLVLVGIAIGAAAAYSAGRLVATMLFGLSFADPLTYGAAAVALVAAALLASWLPVRRASRIDPLVALQGG